MRIRLGKPKVKKLVRESTRQKRRERHAAYRKELEGRIRRAYQDAESLEDIANAVGSKRSTVGQYLSRMKLKAPSLRHTFASRIDQIDWSLPLAEIARRLGCSEGTVSAMKRKLGMKRKGRADPHVRELFDRLPSRFRMRDLPEMLGPEMAVKVQNFCRNNFLTRRVLVDGKWWNEKL